MYVNSKSRSPHGVDALHAEESALANASPDKVGNKKSTEMQENQGGDLRQPDSVKLRENRDTTGPEVRNSTYEI